MTYAYNARGYLESVSSGATTLVRHRSADARGNATDVAYGNGVGTVRGFDAGTGRPESVRTTRGTGATAAVLQANAYAWRSDGSLHSRAGAETETFAYDHLNRLTEARTDLAADRVLSYGYSARGDLESKTDSASAGRSATAYGYDPADRRLDSATVGGVSWTLHHDASGHVTRYERPGDDRFVTWDGRGLATEVRLAASATATSTARDAFAYGPDGARHHRRGEWSGKTEDTYYAGAYEKTYRADGSVVERTRLGAAVHVRTTPAGGGAPSSTWEYLHRDHLGSVESATGGSGAELAALAHDPYGDRRRPDWTGRLTAASSTALVAAQGRRASRGFTGHEHLDRTGLVHMNGRVYDPLLGRFLSPDPVVSGPAGSQGWALYGYVGNNPLSRTDPTGLFVAGGMCSHVEAGCLHFGGGGGPPGGGTRTVTVSSLKRVFGVQVRRTLTAGLTWDRDGRLRVGYGWRTRVRPITAIVRTVRELPVGEETPADEPAGGELVGAPAPTGTAVTANRPVAFVGGFGDRDGSRLVYRAYKDYRDQFPNATAVYFEHHQGTELAEWIDLQNKQGNVPNAIGHSWGAATLARVVSQGHSVNELRTVDPVSRNRPDYAKVSANSVEWINFDAHGKSPRNRSDWLADVGGAWNDAPVGHAKHYPVAMNHDEICWTYCDPNAPLPQK